MKIISPRNDRVRYAAKLARRRFRQREGRFLVEGPRLVGEALTSGAGFHSLFICRELLSDDWNGLLAALPGDVPLHEVPAAVFRELAVTEAPQGILAVVEIRRWDWRDCCRPAPAGGVPLIVLIDALQDPGNLGTIIRAAEALGAGGVILSPETADPWNPKAVRATMGAIFRLPVAVEEPLPDLIPHLRADGVQVLAADPRADRPAYAADWRRPTAVVLGNEGAGVSPEVTSLADGFVSVPMPGRAESLNAGMAAGILLYEAVRQRSAPAGRG